MQEAELDVVYLVAVLITLLLAIAAACLWAVWQRHSGDAFGPPQEGLDDWSVVKAAAPARYAGGSSACGTHEAQTSAVPAVGRHSGSGQLAATANGSCGSSSTIVSGSLSSCSSGGAPLLCRDLVVPAGLEMLFLIPDGFAGQRQQASFGILNVQGEPFSFVVVDEHTADGAGIRVQALDGKWLAFVGTEELHIKPEGLPDIRRASGDLFGTVAREPTANGYQYALTSTVGSPLLTVAGDFEQMHVTVEDSEGLLVCVAHMVEPDFPGPPHCQARVRGADACLVLCALLAVMKAEAALRTTSAR